MSLALVCVRRGDRFDPPTRRALGFTRRAGRKGQFELAICTVKRVLLILSLCGHLPAPDYLPVHAVWAFVRARPHDHSCRGCVPWRLAACSDYYARC